MANPIVPEGETDADRIADFVNGYMGKNRANNRRTTLNVAEVVVAYNLARILRRASKRRRGR